MRRLIESSPDLKLTWNFTKEIHSAAICCVVVFFLGAAVLLTNWTPFQALVNSSSDFLVQNARQPVVPFQFAQVLIDPSSLSLDHLSPQEIEASPGLAMMAAGFPWSREVYAHAIERLFDAGATLIILDVLFPNPREGDEELRAVLSKYPGRVILVAEYVEDLAADGGVVIRRVDPSESVIAPGTSVGFANFWRDDDGVVRSAPFRMERLTGELFYSSPALALGFLKGRAAMDALPESAHFIPSLTGLAPDVRVPLWQIFSPREWTANLQNGKVFRDRVVAIGAAAPQFHDEFKTPLGTFIGAGLHLGALGAAWNERFYSRPSPTASLISLLFGCGATLLAWIGVKKTLIKILVLLALVTVSIPAAVALLDYLNWMPPLAIFLLGLVGSSVSAISTNLVVEGRERIRARRALERYVSPALTREMLDYRVEFLQSLGGARREVTILFSDLRGFTSYAETGEPAQVFEELNEYFGHVVDEILAADGAIDKFLGDGILATWGTLGHQSPSASASAGIRCARAMHDAFDKLNALRISRGLSAWNTGIGLHSGPVLFGNVGSRMRMELTVIGDAVNLASRIEGLTKSLGCNTLISGHCRELAGSEVTLRSAELVKVIGRDAPVSLFTFAPPSFLSSDLALHEEAIQLFRTARFSESLSQFEALIARHPKDRLAAVYRARCQSFLRTPPPAGWSGVVEAAHK